MSAAFELVDIPCLFFNRHGKVTLYNTLARRYIGHEPMASCARPIRRTGSG